MSDRRERIDALLERFRKELSDLRTEALAEIGRAEREAHRKEARYHDAVEELEQVEKQIAAMTAEREELPIRATRAGMDEDYQLEDELKERYKNLRHALEALEDRRGSLKDEIRRLLPRPQGHPNDARIHAMSSAAGAAYGPRQDFEHLLKGLTDALLQALRGLGAPGGAAGGGAASRRVEQHAAPEGEGAEYPRRGGSRRARARGPLRRGNAAGQRAELRPLAGRPWGPSLANRQPLVEGISSTPPA